MTTATLHRAKTPATPVPRPDRFRVVGSEQGLGYNLPQKMGRKLWLPMLALAIMGSRKIRSCS